MESAKIIIAVDGPAGSGKSSVSKEIARELNIRYIDSGALYRALTWYVLDTMGCVERGKHYYDVIRTVDLRQEMGPDGLITTILNDTDVSENIRNEDIAKSIGVISDEQKIREFVNETLRKLARQESVIMDGRDIGTVVFPDAQVKIYLEATVEVRAERRIKEYQEKGEIPNPLEVKEQIMRRDGEDRKRPFGKLIKAPDAILLDTTALTKDEVIKKIIEIIRG